MRFSSKGWAMVAGLVIVAMVSQVALAQQGQGRRGRGGAGGGGFGGGPPSSARLLTLKEVQDALKLTDDQKGKLEKINEAAQTDMRKAMQDGGGREKMQELMASTTAKVNEILDAGQQKRLMGIEIQVNGAGAAADPAVAKELNLTDDQKKQLGEVRQKNMDAMREAFQGGRDQGGREKIQQLRDEANKSMLAVLTADQQAQLESLKGEKVDVDMSQLRGGPGGPGGRGAGRRGRGDGNSESKSDEKSSN
jgi:Spy/CpxP family protein refolding chaperone